MSIFKYMREQKKQCNMNKINSTKHISRFTSHICIIAKLVIHVLLCFRTFTQETCFINEKLVALKIYFLKAKLPWLSTK